MARKKGKAQYEALGYVIRDPKDRRRCFMAWKIDGNGREPLFSHSLGEFWIFKSLKEADKFNQEIKGPVGRIVIKP